MYSCNKYLGRICGDLAFAKAYRKIKDEQGNKPFQYDVVLPNVHKFIEITYHKTIFSGI